MNAAQRVVVTGGAGFIGAAVVRELVSAGHEVAVLDSLRPDVHRDGGAAARERMSTLAVALTEADVRDLAAVSEVMHGADVVVHLAAKVGLGVGLADMDDYMASNALGTAVLLRACDAAQVGRFVQASSMVVYGEGHYTCATHGVVPPAPRSLESLEQKQFEPPCPLCGRSLEAGLVTESAPLDPRNTYAVSKVAQEHLADVWARETGGAAVSLRLHNVYGPGMPRNTPYAGVASIFSSYLDRGEAPRVFEDGRQRRDFVHVDDVGSAFRTVAQARTTGHVSYNVGSGAVRTVGDMARALARARGGPEPVVTGEFRRGDVRHITASSERIAGDLGWRAGVRLEDGVRGLTFG